MSDRPDWRVVVRPALTNALRNKDQATFSFVLVQLLGVATEDEITEFAYQVLDEMHHEVQVWWRDECNCDGHLN